MYSRSSRLNHHLKHSCVPLVLSAFIGLAGCADKDANIFDPEKYDHIDRKQNLSREDYRNMAKVDPDKLEPHFEGEAQTSVDLG
ncbi:MAG: hypothetical protein MK052_08485, partial [Alphaproteobacteria bacterium]|nr:hypothetical protein [Alphaproteobacteria bacterium]